MIVYLDVIILENFLINFFLLVVTMQLCNRKFKYKNLVLASFVGALYTLVMVVDNIRIFSAFPFKILFSFFMIFMVIGKKKIGVIFKTTGVFFLSTIGFSGFCLFISLINNPYDLVKGITINNYSMKALIYSIILFYLISYRIYCYFKDRAIVNNFLFDIEFNIENERIKTKAFLDTGNELLEPVTSLPVIILEKNQINECFFENSRCFYIPYKGIGGFSNEMKAIKVNEIKIINKDGVEFFRTAMVGICNTKLSATDEYNALLPRAII